MHTPTPKPPFFQSVKRCAADEQLECGTIEMICMCFLCTARTLEHTLMGWRKSVQVSKLVLMQKRRQQRMREENDAAAEWEREHKREKKRGGGKEIKEEKMHGDENERAHYLNAPYCLMGDAIHFIEWICTYIVDVSCTKRKIHCGKKAFHRMCVCVTWSLYLAVPFWFSALLKIFTPPTRSSGIIFLETLCVCCSRTFGHSIATNTCVIYCISICVCFESTYINHGTRLTYSQIRFGDVAICHHRIAQHRIVERATWRCLSSLCFAYIFAVSLVQKLKIFGNAHWMIF